MAEVLLMWGRSCSGKSGWARAICEETGALCLSVDELMLDLLPERLGEMHDQVTEKAQNYLLHLAARIAKAGVPVVLDWGFWTRRSRSAARAFFREAGVPCRLYYLEIGDAALRCNIAHRNARVRRGETRDYFVDEGLFQKMQSRFEPPEEGEIDRILRGKPGDMPGEAGKE